MERRYADYIFRSYARRKAVSAVMTGLACAAALLALVPLFSILGYVAARGLPALDLAFFTELPKPVGESGGGMANALAGTCTLITLAALIGVPWGVAVGVYLSEYGGGLEHGIKSRLAAWARFCADLLAAIPSIILGLFVYAAVVVAMKRFSALAGGMALGLLMIPTVCRSTEELLRLVPTQIREAGLALGIPRWKVILAVIVKGSARPILTGVMLSVARVAGETAPLLFTSFNNRFWQSGLLLPIASLPVQIFTYAVSPYEEWHRQAWGGALVLVLLVLALNLATRLAAPKGGSA